MVRVPACHAGGRGFEPRQPRHTLSCVTYHNTARAPPTDAEARFFADCPRRGEFGRFGRLRAMARSHFRRASAPASAGGGEIVLLEHLDPVRRRHQRSDRPGGWPPRRCAGARPRNWTRNASSRTSKSRSSPTSRPSGDSPRAGQSRPRHGPWSPRWAATCTASTTGFRGTRSSWLCHARLADSSASTERAMRLGSESEVYKLLRYH